MQLDGVVEQFEELGLRYENGEVWKLEGPGFTRRENDEPDEEYGGVARATTRPRRRHKKADAEEHGKGESVLSKALERRLSRGNQRSGRRTRGDANSPFRQAGSRGSNFRQWLV